MTVLVLDELDRLTEACELGLGRLAARQHDAVPHHRRRGLQRDFHIDGIALLRHDPTQACANEARHGARFGKRRVQRA